MNIENISVGDIYPNYKSLCEKLDDSYFRNSGNARKKQLTTWSRFFEYEKIGIKFKIVQIYDEPKPEIIWARNIKFTNIICHLLMMNINKSEQGCIITTTNKMMSDLGMMSKQFKNQCVNNRNLDDTAIDFVYSELKKRLGVALRSLEKNNIIKLNTYNVKIVDSDKWETEIFTDEENEQLAKINDECMWEYQLSRNRKVFTNIQSIKLECGLTEYMKIRNKKISEAFGCKVMKQHHLEKINSNAVYGLEDDLINLNQSDLEKVLNQRLCDSMMSTLDTKTRDVYNPSYERMCKAKDRITNFVNMNRIDNDAPVIIVDDNIIDELETLNEHGIFFDDTDDDVPDTTSEYYESRHKNKRRRKCFDDYS